MKTSLNMVIAGFCLHRIILVILLITLTLLAFWNSGATAPEAVSQNQSAKDLELVIEAHDGRISIFVKDTTQKRLISVEDAASVLPNQISLSPDGRWISLVQINNQSTHFDLTGASIWLIDVLTRQKSVLIEAGSDFLVTNPLWSPDASQIAYAKIYPARSLYQNVIAELWISDLAGNKRPLVTDETFGPAFFFGRSFAMAWSSSGMIQYYDEIGTRQVFEVDISTGYVYPAATPYSTPIQQYLERIEESRQLTYTGMVKPIIGLPDYEGWSDDPNYSVAYIDDYYGSSFEGSGGHPGVDITYSAACPGGPEVVSVADGVIWDWINSTNSCTGGSSFGNYAIIRIDNTPPSNGYPGGTFYFLYGHLRDISLPPCNCPVQKGDLVGHVGSTGNSSNPHLHFQLEPDLGQMHPWYDPGCTTGNRCGLPYRQAAMDNTDDPMRFVQAHMYENQGIKVCEHDNLQGRCEFFTVNDPFLADNPIWGNNPVEGPPTISSLQVPWGWIIKLHDQYPYQQNRWWGDSVTFTGPITVNSLGQYGFNDRTRSLQIIGGACVPGLSPNLDPNVPLDDCGPSSIDNATFVADITLPDGSMVNPGQAYVKTWRMRNTGGTTWGNGYQLAFVSGERMGAPTAVNVPTTAPGQDADISINIVAPLSSGEHTGYWRLRNPQGTYFGPIIWVRIVVQSSSPYITVFTADPPSPSNATSVRIHARVEGFPNFRAMRLKVDNGVVYEIGAPEFYYDWNTSGYAGGDHSLVVEVADQTDTSWSHPERRGMIYTLQGSPAPNNHAPDRPTLERPYDWYVTIGNPPELCANPVSDPDGDPVQYYFETSAPVGSANSGWIGSRCWTPPSSLDPATYSWHVKARDNYGAQSDWSDTWHYSVESSGVTITELYFEPLDPNQEEVRIRACTTGHAGVNISLSVRVNDANDGTDSGQWHIIKELGVPCFNPIDAPIWRTLEYGDGPHLVRVVATAINPPASDVRDAVYTLNHRRPASPRLLAPVPLSENIRDPIYLNSRIITFTWESTIRAITYALHIGTNPSPISDPNPVFRQTFASSVLSHTVTFDQDYPTLYWQVSATNDVGTNASGDQLFGIDRVMPSCTVQPLPPVTPENVFQVGWNGLDSLAGIRTYDIQYLDSGRGSWYDWLTNVPVTKTFDLFTGQPGHTYYYRCRATDNANNVGDYPTDPDTFTLVDPTARPPTPWWDLNYADKRNLIIQNNMPSVTLPAGYPVHLHFDSTTTPTAEELYNASQSTPKCNDLRVVYNDTTELDRVMQNCSSSAIDFWFRTQVSIPGGAANDTAHQLYYGNPDAGTPPGSPNTVFDPPSDANTVGLWYMHEGSGSTLSDSSGYNNHCTIDSTTTWVRPAKFSGALHFLGGTDGPTVNCGSSSVLNLQTFSFELWLRGTGNAWGRLAGQMQAGVNQRWILEYESGKIRAWIWTNSGSATFYTNTNFNGDTNWHHVAFTVEGTAVRVYVDGNLERSGTLPAPIRSANLPLTIGSAENISRAFADITHVRFSNIARTGFQPYAAFASITNEPTTAAGGRIPRPGSGRPDLSILSMSAQPHPSGGVQVKVVARNEGSVNTENGFYTDLCPDQVSTCTTNFVEFWVNDPITASATITLTTVITDVTRLGGMGMHTLSPTSEITSTLYAYVDSTGVVSETNNLNNISPPLEICLANPDAYESDDTSATARPISVGEAQTHNFHRPDDRDWVHFDAISGTLYLLRTFNLGPSSDTYLYLYDTDGSTLLASSDDYGGTLASYIEWTAPLTGTYYLEVRHWNPTAGGCGTRYDLEVTQPAALSFALQPGPPGDVALNDIALPLDVSAIFDAESLAQYIETRGSAPFGSVQQLLKWDALNQTFLSWSHEFSFGDNFPTAPGDYIFLILTSDAPTSVTFVGRAPAPGEVVFSLTPGTASQCVYNFLSLPLDHPEITTADELADAIGIPSPPGPPSVVQALDWEASGQFFLAWGNVFNSGDNFPTTVGYPYIVCLSDNGVPPQWP